MEKDLAAVESPAVSRPATVRLPLHRTLLIATVAYFLVFGILMAHLGGQPDQTKHRYFSFRFAETWGIPREDPTSPFRITGNTYLYYWLNGAVLKIAHVVAPGADTLQETYLLRLVSLCLSALTLLYTYKLASKVTGNPYAGVLAGFFMANTLMFVFVSSGVSYDNLMNLASMAAIYHLVNIFKREDFVRNSALVGLWLCIGALAKEQVLLLAFLLFVAWLAYAIRARKSLSLTFGRANVAWITVLLVFFVLFLGLYGANIVRYRSLIPQCSEVKAAEYCTLFAERRALRHPIDIAQLWNKRETITNPFLYVFGFWTRLMLGSIWGVISANTYVPWLSVSLHGCLVLWAAVCVIRYWKREERIPTLLLLLFGTYLVYLLVMNYTNELRYDFKHFAVQGRYLSPMFGVLFTLMINYFLRIRSLFLRRMTLALSLIIYFAGGLGLFIFRYPEIFSYWKIYF